MTLTANCTHDGHDYEARLTHDAGRTRVVLSRDGIDAGRGRWWMGGIVECSVGFSADAYEAIDRAIVAAVNARCVELGDEPTPEREALTALVHPTRC
jgi:hypothetical protein